ncbi:MAG TPA: TetR/AcrR family transcriptional regulator [Polyangiaceae bacterium]|nr:TetR/AcrR family transcriptional regulator [Polyangiaceae bacterium]
MARPRTDIAPRIVHAARQRFLREGVDGASLRRIARDAKTSIGMVYYYFPTKDDLFLAVVEEVYVALLADLEVALAPDAPVPVRVQRFYERIARLHDDELLMVRLVLREALTSTSRLDRLIERFQRGHIPLLIRMVQDGTANGTFGAQHSPLTVALSLVSLAGPAQLIRRVIEQRLPFVEAPKGNDLAAELADVLFNGVAARPQS